MRFTIVMGNQDLSVIWNILKILNILVRMLFLLPPPPDAGDNDSDNEDNESVVEVGYESNNDSSPPVHVIP